MSFTVNSTVDEPTIAVMFGVNSSPFSGREGRFLQSTKIAERLEARGYAAAAMNGDMAQKDREKMVARLKNKSLSVRPGKSLRKRRKPGN